MQFYLLDTRQLWGDYGDHLINGRSSRRVDGTEPLVIDRLGPFVPPLFKCGTNFLVTDEIKTRVEREAPFAVAFRSATFGRVHRLDWQRWDLSAKLPAQVPEEPDDYFRNAAPPSWWPRWLERHRSRSLARRMPRIWELVPALKWCKVEYLSFEERDQTGYRFAVAFPQGEHTGLFYSSNHCLYVVADEPTRAWLASVFGEWIHFWPLLKK